jgi:hypothetical protein
MNTEAVAERTVAGSRHSHLAKERMAISFRAQGIAVLSAIHRAKHERISNSAS